MKVMIDDIQIYNTHLHLFTKKNVPDQLYGYLRWVSFLLNVAWIRDVLALVLRFLSFIPLYGQRLAGFADRLPHLAAFTKMIDKDSQEKVFNEIQRYYPKNSRFVVLPMDFSKMGYGNSRESTSLQHDELAKLRDKFPESIIPFVHFDPQRDNALQLIKEWIITHKFKGVKIYPPMGYAPTDDRLTKIYEFCNEYRNGLPVMTHCSGASVRAKQYASSRDKHIASQYCDPENYIPILEHHKNLRLCLGHFGGDGAWETYLNEPYRRGTTSSINGPEKTFLPKILKMLQSEKYPNLYVDISYVIFNYRENSHVLKVLLEDQRIRSQVLFGTDFYMAKLEKFSEKQLSIFLRATIGESYFKEIAETNPKRFLFG